MRFGLDFDGTYTAAPTLWQGFVRLAKEQGHEVVITTYRSDDGDNDDVEAACQIMGIPVVYTDTKQKQHCYNADVWIDDQPELCPSFRHLAGQYEFCKVTKDFQRQET